VEDVFQHLLKRIIGYKYYYLEKKGISIKKGPRIGGLVGPDGFQKRYNRCC
jgi:hypothetical protein